MSLHSLGVNVRLTDINIYVYVWCCTSEALIYRTSSIFANIIRRVLDLQILTVRHRVPVWAQKHRLS